MSTNRIGNLCSLCKNGISSWNCYSEFRNKSEPQLSFNFCNKCKSKWIAYARSCGITFDIVSYYTDGCSCHYLQSVIAVKKIWRSFISRKLYLKRKEDIVQEKVSFT